MTIVSQPKDYNFSGNIPDFIIESLTDVPFKLYRGCLNGGNGSAGGSGSVSGSGSGSGGIPAEAILDETYTPDDEGKIVIELNDYLSRLLTIVVPDLTLDTYHQEEGYDEFTAIIGSGVEKQTICFYAIKGGVDNIADDPTFIQASFLTWQEPVKYVKIDDPEWITYFAQEAVRVKAKGIFTDGSESTITLQVLSSNQLTSVNTRFGLLSEQFSETPAKIDVWIEPISAGGSGSSSSGSSGSSAGGIPPSPLTGTQRYVLYTEPFDHDDIFLFTNSIGGVDCIRFTGRKQKVESFGSDRAVIDDESIEYFTKADQKFRKNTGSFRSTRHLLWSRDFFASTDKYHYLFGALCRVVTNKTDLANTPLLLASYNFIYMVSRQSIYQNYYELFPDLVTINAPEDLEGIVVSSSEVDLSWTDTNNGLSRYQIWYKKASDETFSLYGSTSEGEDSLSLVNLDHDTAYEFKVRAVSIMTSDFSSSVELTTSVRYKIWLSSKSPSPNNRTYEYNYRTESDPVQLTGSSLTAALFINQIKNNVGIVNNNVEIWNYDGDTQVHAFSGSTLPRDFVYIAALDEILICDQSANLIRRYDGTDYTSSGTIACTSPYGIALKPDGSEIYVTSVGNSIEVYEATSGAYAFVKSIAFTAPRGIAFAPGDNDHLYLTNGSANDLTKILSASPYTQIAIAEDGNGGQGLVIDPERERIYVTRAVSYTHLTLPTKRIV